MKQNKKIIVFEHLHDLSIYLLKHWMKTAQETIQEQEKFCVALQGGVTFKDFLSKLSEVQDYHFWENIHIFQTDQLHLPHNNSIHQFQFLKNNLIDYINIPAQNVHSIVTHTENLKDSVDQYQEDLTRIFELPINNSPKFDYVIMGLNQIDHLKSIFKQDSTKIPMVEKCNNLISIHPKVLADAKHIIFVGSGESAALNAYEMIEIWGKALPTTTQGDLSLTESLVFLLDSVAAHKLSTNYDHFNHSEGVILFDKEFKI